jgi:hypothetical protein
MSDLEIHRVSRLLAVNATESTAHMELSERKEGIAQMLRDLYRLAREDGCVSAAWALEYLQTYAGVHK